MKKAIKYLSGMKSRCFMLLTCLILLVGATSCSSDDFGTNLPDDPKQLSKSELLQKYSKAELIEQALSRMPKTRATNSCLRMITIKDSITIRYSATEDMKIHVNNKTIIPMKKGNNITYSYGFPDDDLSHVVEIRGSQLAIQSLNIDDNGLIWFEIYSNENLVILSCVNNHLDELNLTKFPKLHTLYITNNEFSNIDITCLPQLQVLRADNNQLTAVSVSENLNLRTLNLERNNITNIDLSKNTNLTGFSLSHNPITNLDLSKNINLSIIFLENVPIQTINDVIISDTIFSFFPKLSYLNIAYTSFDALNLSCNPLITWIDISGTAITQLDISNLQIRLLNATRSKLTNLIYEKKDLNNLYELRIESTPFEKVWDNINSLSSNLPERSETNPGHLYTYSKYIYLLEINRNDHWLINQ